MAINGMPEKSAYDVFRHEFKRGMDPELYWLDKYKNDDDDTKMPQLETDIRSLYAHEDVRPEAIIEKMYELHEVNTGMPSLFDDLYEDDEEQDELERLAGYYKHEDNWRNRLIGDARLPEADRKTYATVNPYDENSGLQESGLLGPVRLVK